MTRIKIETPVMDVLSRKERENAELWLEATNQQLREMSKEEKRRMHERYRRRLQARARRSHKTIAEQEACEYLEILQIARQMLREDHFEDLVELLVLVVAQ
jgi:hypothetical protein